MTELSEEPAERASKYITTLETALRRTSMLEEKTTVEASNIAKVADAIQRYLQDARFYLKKSKPVTSLASIAYAEGLLDALTFLDLARKENLP